EKRGKRHLCKAKMDLLRQYSTWNWLWRFSPRLVCAPAYFRNAEVAPRRWRVAWDRAAKKLFRWRSAGSVAQAENSGQFLLSPYAASGKPPTSHRAPNRQFFRDAVGVQSTYRRPSVRLAERRPDEVRK